MRFLIPLSCRRRKLQPRRQSASLQHKVAEMQHTEESTSGSTTSDVANARAKISSAKAQLLQAQAALDRTASDSRRAIELAKAGIASDQERVQAETNLQAAQATVQAQQELVKAAEADLNSAIARTHQANAAQSTVASTEADLKNAVAHKNQAAVRLGYTNVYAPVDGTVSVRAARQGEVVNIGAPIVTIVDLSDTWARAAIPETYADHIGYGDVLRVRLPGGTVMKRKSFLQRCRRGLRHAARREPPQARHQNHRAENSHGKSQRRVCARHDRRSVGVAGTTEGNPTQSAADAEQR